MSLEAARGSMNGISQLGGNSIQGIPMSPVHVKVIYFQSVNFSVTNTNYNFLEYRSSFRTSKRLHVKISKKKLKNMEDIYLLNFVHD